MTYDKIILLLCDFILSYKIMNGILSFDIKTKFFSYYNLSASET